MGIKQALNCFIKKSDTAKSLINFLSTSALHNVIFLISGILVVILSLETKKMVRILIFSELGAPEYF